MDRRRSMWPIPELDSLRVEVDRQFSISRTRTASSSPEKKPRFVITLSDEEFAKLSDRREHLTEILRTGNGDVEVIIQRQGE